MLTPHSRIYIAGHTGLAGSSLLRLLQKRGFKNLITAARSQVDLTRQKQVESFFAEEKPEFVFLSAALVGGIQANISYPAEFIYQNLMIESHIIHESARHGVKRLIFLGSSCIYPKFAPQPIKEDSLLSASLEETNEPYAVAKIAGIEMIKAYNRQYGCQFLGAMPTNLFGPNDNYDLETSHVLPALIRKMHEAKVDQKPSLTLWGSGSVKREFLFVDDLAEALLFLMQLPEESYQTLSARHPFPIVNIGAGKDLTIKELAEMVGEIVGYRGEMVWDRSRPDGTPRKCLDVSRMEALGWKSSTSLKEGIERTYKEYTCGSLSQV